MYVCMYVCMHCMYVNGCMHKHLYEYWHGSLCHIYPSILNACQGRSLPESKEEPVKGFNVVNEGDDDDHSVDGFADSPGPHHIHIYFDHTYTLHNRFTFFPATFTTI